MLKRSFFLLLLILITIPSFLYADIEPTDRTIEWRSFTHVVISETRTVTELSFVGASYNIATADLPVYSERFSIANKNSKVEAFVTNQQWEDLNENDIIRLNGHDLIASDLELHTRVSIERKQAFAVASFVPLRKNSSTGKYQKLLSFTLRLRITDAPALQHSPARVYKQNSVLASGDWFKVAVQFTGVHKITYSDLSAMGLSPSSIDPRNLRIYGNGGGMLPEPNADFRYDDLMENAIIVSGEADGSFNEGDYILFYGESPNTWTWDAGNEKFIHKINIYSDYTYYFITADLGPGKRIQSQASTSQPATHQVNKFTDMQYIDKDETNLVRTGRDWFEYPPYEIQTSNDYSFSIPDIDVNEPVIMTSRVAARSSTSSTFKYYLGSTQLIYTLNISPVSFTSDEYAKVASFTETFVASGASINIKVNYNKPLSASIGWMDYIALNARRSLKLSAGQMSFRDPRSMGAGNIAEYSLGNANASTIIWDVTDALNIKKINGDLSGTTLKIRLAADTLNELIAFNGTSYYSTSFIEKVPNQNLHSISIPDLVIIAHPAFLAEATRVANHHIEKDGLEVFVTDVEKVYNEFSSGGQDATAIRDFMKMMYDKSPSGGECLYLMLFGDASFDYKDRIENNTNMVPTWEDKLSMNITHSIATDDYFGLLDDDEGGYGGSGLLDMGIGRLVVSTQESARQMVDKILHYANGDESVFGSWRNVVCFVADDEDNNLHLGHAEQMANKLEANYGDLNIDKIYVDAYPQVSTSGGQRVPLVNQAINRRMDKGALVMNYTGHGGEVGWGHERFLEISDINSWTNYDKMPVFITATCEFSRYDDPTRVSAGELVLLNPNGGSIGLFTTARATYGSPNFELNNAMYNFMFEKIDGEYPRFGDLIRLAKNESGNVSNKRKFILLGDPALKLAYPEHNVNTIKINDIVVGSLNDTIKALQKVKVIGNVLDENGSVLNSFNGILRPTVYDKPTKVKTLGTDEGSNIVTFEVLTAILYNGKASVNNGEFSFTFIVPKDIAYNYGYGKISYYANDATSDANGNYQKIVIGSYDNSVPPDNTGPDVQLYMNDENFAFGGITNENPVLLAYVSDSSGINTVGTGIGHDIVAALDNDNNKSVNINDYYESDVDSYTTGVVTYPFTSLSEGNHTLSLKVWDVHNNSSEAYTEFVVSSSAELAIDHVLNYPNPFTTSTAFYFDHNQPNNMLEVQVQIYTVSGRLIKTIDEFVITNGYRSEPIHWDGLDDFGDRIGRGVYIYKMRVRSQDGTYAEKLEKLVILR